MLCFSAISAIGITLLLIGSILIIGLHVNYFSNDVQKDLSIHVILNEDINDEASISNIQNEISKLKNVSKVEVSSKDDELELMIKEKGAAFKAYRGETNPLSNAFFVYVRMLLLSVKQVHRFKKSMVYRVQLLEETVLQV